MNALAAALATAAGYAIEHPDIALRLVRSIADLFDDDGDDPIHPDALSAREAGLAAIRANAVQEAQRRNERRKSG